MSNQGPHRDGLFSKGNISSLLIGTLLAFLVGKFLDPLFAYLYSLFLNTGGVVVTSISNSTYKQISNGFSEQPSMLSFYLLCILSWVILSCSFTALRNSYKQILDTYKKYNEILDIVKNTPLDDNLNYDTTNSSISLPANGENNPEILAEKITLNLRKVKIEYRLIIIIFVFLYIFLIFTYSRSLYINDKITSLTNNIEIVSPYISDINYKQLKSNFHMMENSEDYNNLMSELSDIAKDHSLTLKK